MKTIKILFGNIISDEKKHNQIFRDIYFDITGIVLPSQLIEPRIPNNLEYIENLKKGLFGEHATAKKYMNLKALMFDKKYSDVIDKIVTDELIHSSIYNYLIAINKK